VVATVSSELFFLGRSVLVRCVRSGDHVPWRILRRTLRAGLGPSVCSAVPLTYELANLIVKL